MKVSVIVLLFISALYISSSINVPTCSSGSVKVFFKDSNKGTSDNTTYATLCHDKVYMYVTWENIDSDIITTYTNCNDPLYKQDAVQIFIASPKSYPSNYYEIQISPKGVLFYSDVTNPSGNCSKFTGQYLDCNLISASGKIMSKGWEANLKVQLKRVLRNESQNFIYANLFRQDHSKTQPTKYLAMNPTLTPTPCFHVPSKFQKFIFIGLNSTNLSHQ